MAKELEPGLFSSLFVRTLGAGETYARTALAPVADALVKRVKTELSLSSSPAPPGAPPGVRSGTLRASIGRSSVDTTAGVASVLVGTQTGYRPPYKPQTPANKYGLYLETMQNHAFLRPSAEMTTGLAIPLYYSAIYASSIWSLIRI